MMRLGVFNAIGAFIVLTLRLSVGEAIAADAILDQRPFDQIILKQGGETLQVLPLDLPGRRVPKPFPPGHLTVRLVANPSTPYEVAWSAIARIVLHEQILLNQAKRLTLEGKFDQAFDYFAFLQREHPNLTGLNSAKSEYLFKNANDAFKEGRYDLALAILLSLSENTSSKATLGRAVDVVAEKIIQDHLKRRDLNAARTTLDVIEKEFSEVQVSVVGKWRSKFKEAADKKTREGIKRLERKDYAGARRAARDALAVWPNHRGAAKLLEKVSRIFPILTVGVRIAASASLQPRLDFPETLRLARLTDPTLTSINAYGDEGGVYGCPLGSIEVAESGRALRFDVSPSRNASVDLTPFAVANWLLQMSDPSTKAFDPAVAGVALQVQVEEGRQVGFLLRRAHVRPEALFQRASLPSAGIETRGAEFIVTDRSESHQLMQTRHRVGSVPAIEERFGAKGAASLQSLLRGDIDALDRIAPWEVEMVRQERSLQLGEYALPTVHVLIPSRNHPLLNKREFRRALCYGIDRHRILREILLGGTSTPGFHVVSGPFPTGKSLNDPVRYGYNDGVAPRPYEPRLAAILAMTAWAGVQKEQHGKEAPADSPFPKLRLAHSTSPVARSACQAIRIQLRAIGLDIELVELPSDALANDAGEFELRYAELCLWEPVVDARRLLGPAGLAGRCSDSMLTALDKLDHAQNWNEVGTLLRDLHELAHGDLPVLPLWQTVNYYAYSRQIRGLPQSTVSLYQTVRDWRRDLPQP